MRRENQSIKGGGGGESYTSADKIKANGLMVRRITKKETNLCIWVKWIMELFFRIAPKGEAKHPPATHGHQLPWGFATRPPRSLMKHG